MSKALAKRLRVLEEKQKADDKTTEFKVSYYLLTQLMDNSWGVNSGMAPRTTHGTGAEGTISGGTGAIRIGNEINLRHWGLEGYVELPKTADGLVQNPTSQVPCRIIIADNLSDDTPLTASDVLQNPSSSADSLISPYKNSANASKRYRVYADYKFTLTQEKDKRIKFKMPLPKSGRVIHYANGAAVSPSDFNVTLLFFANVSPVGSNDPKFHYQVKCRFTDA